MAKDGKKDPKQLEMDEKGRKRIKKYGNGQNCQNSHKEDGEVTGEGQR